MSIQVLHVDDEEDFLYTSKAILENISTDLIINSITNPNEVIEELEKNKYDILISDYQMIPLTGLELLTKLRQENYLIPIIIFTGRSREEVAIQALNLGANYYLTKGGDVKNTYSELLHIIQKEVSHSRTEQALNETRTAFQTIIDKTPFALSDDDWSEIKKELDLLSQTQEIEDYQSYFENNQALVNQIFGKIKVGHANESIRKLLGLDLTAQITGKILQEIIPLRIQIKLLLMVIEQQPQVELFEVLPVQGQKKYLQFMFSLVEGHQDTYDRVIVSIADVTNSTNYFFKKS